MNHFTISRHSSDRTSDPLTTETPVYSREAFRAILARQPEWKIRAALEDGNIPSSNVAHAVEWLNEQEHHHPTYWM
jgi:hypothetical protein